MNKSKSQRTVSTVATDLHDRDEFRLKAVEVISLQLYASHYLVLETSGLLQLRRQSSTDHTNTHTLTVFNRPHKYTDNLQVIWLASHVM